MNRFQVSTTPRQRRGRAVPRALAVLAVGALLTSACGAGKIQQCNKLIEKVNAASAAVSKSNGGAGKASDMDAMAKALDQAKTDITTVQLEDAKLKGYQQDYSKMLDKVSTSAKAISAASAKNDAPGLQAAMKDIQAATAEETTIVNNINTYCSGK
jgi:acyl-coenzyme A synthetase/AMP-(fatty) acid ligase